ncbi:hypothetical protein SKAU_G00056720 [Synaphobranchus kaupii]|uniref:DUF4708 domain-containing protein n=1 Tax=Synaphobranchus kaupii TaxID=118154 RepID=A0A9Q1JAC3_SYNKA|nr:hypothetical protein SKAU_G00056720 [Synaphobranchus kaupii]
MSQIGEQNLFFLNLPDLRKLCCITLSLLCGCDDGELRNTQMGVPQRVLPSTLQGCLSYTLTVKLAPNWNKVGQFLVAAMQLSVSESQLCLSVEADAVRLPPATLEDFDIAPNVMRRFHSSRDAVINSLSLPSNWCYILPSMKRGQIISISHQIPAECPFQSYADIRKHWSSLYGYQLPPVDEQDVVYCSVYFKLVGERLFTAQPIQRFPRFDLQGALSSFLLDLRGELQSVCGFPIRMTSKPCYYTTSLTAPGSQGSSSRPVNLTTRSTCRPVLTQLPSRILQNAPGVGTAVERCPSQSGPPSPPAPPPLLPPAPAHRTVPIFRNKGLDRHVNVTKILAERRQQRREEGHQQPAGFGGPAIGPAPSSKRRQEAHLWEGQSQPGPASHPRVENSLCEQGRNGEGTGRGLEPRGILSQSPAYRTEIPALIPSSAGGDWFQSKPKKAKVSVVEVDVEHYARGHQLSKINAATLQAWLRERGVPVRSKDKKEELVTKVLHCLSEP